MTQPLCSTFSRVARIYRPGAKADCCLILEGPQGIKKSTALRTLAGEYFTDELADLGSKDAALQIRGVWIVEISELDSLARSEIASIKAFMSRTADRFRPPFGKRVIECPRQCVFAGTVNHTEYLRDETGARRFWPVLCGAIDIEALARDRDQLWAEAKSRYSSGEKWWLDTSALVEIAAEEQAARYQGDPWEEVVAPWLEARTSVSISEVLDKCVCKPQAQWTQADKNRVGRCLRALGFLHLDAVIAAAVLAFGFVYVHPFVDGNGRLHRYLIHHVLAERGYNPASLVFPVSAAILERIDEYRAVLEDYSKRLMQVIDGSRPKMATYG